MNFSLYKLNQLIEPAYIVETGTFLMQDGTRLSENRGMIEWPLSVPGGVRATAGSGT